MTTTPNPPRVHIDLTLATLDPDRATFAGYLRAEPADAAAEGFGIEGATRIVRSIRREEWEALGSPVVVPITLHNVTASQ